MKKSLLDKKGFTLIELLVVIAIIGILSSIVIASVNSARSKSSDSALRVALREYQKSMTDYSVTNNIFASSTLDGGWGDTLESILGGSSSFSPLNWSDSVAKQIFQNISDNSVSFSAPVYGTTKGVFQGTYGTTNFGWMFVTKSKNGDYLCIDSLSLKVYKIQSDLSFLTSAPPLTGCAAREY